MIIYINVQGGRYTGIASLLLFLSIALTNDSIQVLCDVLNRKSGNNNCIDVTGPPCS
jgi:hypothetical protein